MPPKKLKAVPHYSNKTPEGLTETQVLAQDAKKKKKKPTHDMYGNKIFDTGNPSAFEKKD